MSDQTSIISAKCISHAFDSKNAIQYFPGLEYPLDLADKEQRKLVWLKTLGGRWVFTFDRANSSSIAARIFFCKECGQPFDRVVDLSNHTKTSHPPKKKDMEETQAIEDAEEEERLLAERRAAEAAEDKLTHAVEACEKTIAGHKAEQVEVAK